MRVYRSTNLSPVFLSIFIVAISMLGISAANIQAATFTVVNTNDSGVGSLRQAIADANAAAGADTIDFDTVGVFATPQTITLTSEDLLVTDVLTISGTGADRLVIVRDTSGAKFRIFTVISAATVFNGITVSGGDDLQGSGIYNSGTLTLNNCRITSNRVSDPSLESEGGGIYNSGTLTINSSTISRNKSFAAAGVHNTGTLTVNNSTFFKNDAIHGGALFNDETLTINNSTISDNRASTQGGGIYTTAGTVTLLSTIVANNSAHSGNDIEGTVTSGNYCLVEDPNGASISGANNITGVDPMLASPALDGGSTETMALLLGSPAIDKGKNPNGFVDDQRGQPRTINDLTVVDATDGDSTDIGAVESNFLVVNTTAQDDDGACQPLPDGDCSLREAIIAANAAPGTETIVFDIPTSDPGYDAVADRYTIALTTVLPDLDSDMSIEGLGATRLTVGRDPTASDFRIFKVNSARMITISGVTISGGRLSTSLFPDGAGGGIFNRGTLSIVDSTVSGNIAEYAGGIENYLGNLTITSSTISGNSALIGGGGGIENHDGMLSVSRSTVSNNSSFREGAILHTGGVASISNSTISGNSANLGSGVSSFDGTLTLIGSTVTHNSATTGGGVYSLASTTVISSIVAHNSAVHDPDLVGRFTAYNSLVENTAGATFLAGSSGNIFGVDPLLGPLQDNGGATMTHTLLCGSPAIDAGVANALATDQRGVGFARTFDDPAMANAADSDGTDIGAFELQAPLVCNTAPVANPDSFTINEDPASPVTFNVLANDTDADSDVLTTQVVQAAAHGSLQINGDGSISYFPGSNFNGTDSFTYRAKDASLFSNVATVTITVNPVNDAPVVSATPLIQSGVQYSDAISTVNITASDVETPAANLTIAFTYSKDGGAYQPGLPTGMVQGGTGGAWTVSGVAGVSQGAYAIRATVTDTGDGASPPRLGGAILAIEVPRENAVAAPKASNPVSMQVGSPGGTASGTTGQICFDITEPSDGSPGNTALIDSATVTINTVGGGGAGGVTASARTFSGGSVGGTRTACFTLNFAGVAPNVFEVTLVIGGNYYTGSGTTVFTVFDPSSGFASGGGWIINPNTGYRANFGVNVKYLKNGNAQGSVLYVEHRPDGDYKVKSNSLNSTGGFAILPITGGAEADIAGKANYTVNDVGTGNYSFIARLIDKGTPGTNDQFGLKLINPLGQIVNGFTFNPVVLGGGNNQVPKK